MERLTIRVDNGLDDIYFAVASDPEGEYNIHDLAQYSSENGDLLTFIADRLAEYEDTGLTPEEITGLKPLIDADKEGRAVILPCKVGSPVFITVKDCCCVYDGDMDDCSCCDYVIMPCDDVFRHDENEWECGFKPHVVEDIFCVSMYDEIGKTVFLTPEEAEAALKEGRK